jgi:rhamnosyltransferase
VFASLQYPDLFEDALVYLTQIPSDIDVYILIGRQKEKEVLENHIPEANKNIKLCATESEDPGNMSLLRECSKRADAYEYICLLHDVQTRGNEGAFTVGASYRYNIWNNLIKNQKYISNILDTFEKNPRLGLLAPPIPLHNQYFRAIGSLWENHYNSSLNLIREMKLDCVVSQSVSPYTKDMLFWCRIEALRPLFAWCKEQEDIENSKEIELILPYIAQHQGFYSGWVMNQDYASLQIGNLQYMLGELVAIGEAGMHHNAAYYLSFRELLSYGYGTVGVKGALKTYLKKRLPKPLVLLLKHTLGRFIS